MGGMAGGMTRMADTNSGRLHYPRRIRGGGAQALRHCRCQQRCQVTREERQAAHAKMRAAHQGQGATAQAPAGDDND
jgi:hypothetical protein